MLLIYRRIQIQQTSGCGEKKLLLALSKYWVISCSRFLIVVWSAFKCIHWPVLYTADFFFLFSIERRLWWTMTLLLFWTMVVLWNMIRHRIWWPLSTACSRHYFTKGQFSMGFELIDMILYPVWRKICIALFLRSYSYFCRNLRSQYCLSKNAYLIKFRLKDWEEKPVFSWRSFHFESDKLVESSGNFTIWECTRQTERAVSTLVTFDTSRFHPAVLWLLFPWTNIVPAVNCCFCFFPLQHAEGKPALLLPVNQA